MPDLGTNIGLVRMGMKAYRLAFEDACDQTPYGAGTVLSELQAFLAATTTDARTKRRYDNITIFERLKLEIQTYFQNVDGVNLTDPQVDDLFYLAMEIEADAA